MNHKQKNVSDLKVSYFSPVCHLIPSFRSLVSGLLKFLLIYIYTHTHDHIMDTFVLYMLLVLFHGL